MDLYPYFGWITSGLIYLVAGVRVYSLSRRTGESSERLMAASLLLWGLSYFLYEISYAVAGDESRISLFFEVAWRAANYAADIAFALFTRRVFRTRERWATWLVAGIALCLIVGAGGLTWRSEWEGAHLLSSPWYWLESVGVLTPSVWMGIEGIAQHRKARQRRRLGLCTPLICNRYLLWGLAGILWGSSELVAIPQLTEFEIFRGWSISVDALVTSLDIPAVCIMWTVFFPPAFYRYWIEKLGAVADAAAEGSPHGG
jgi:hypothetical protein